MIASADPPSAAQLPTPVAVELPITLGQFVKLAGLAATGGAAKQLVSSGLVLVNGQIEERRGHKLGQGDVVESGGAAARVIPLNGALLGYQERGSGCSGDRQGLHEDGSVPYARPPTDS